MQVAAGYGRSAGRAERQAARRCRRRIPGDHGGSERQYDQD